MIENFAGAHQLTEVYMNPVLNDFRHLIDLLSIQTRLKTLTLVNVFDVPAEIELRSMKCKLENLNMIIFVNGISEKILQFMKLFRSSVSNLATGGNYASQELMLPMIRDNFKVLKSLVLGKLAFPSPEFYEQQQTKFVGLDSLHIHAEKFRNNAELAGFFSLFPSIKQLRISFIDFDLSITEEDIRNVTLQLDHVNSLIVVMSIGMMQHAAFKNLSHIHFESFDASEKVDWKKLFESNPKLQSLGIKIKWNEDQLDFEALMQMELCVRINGNFKMTMKRLKSFAANSARIMSLLISKLSLTMTEKTFNKIAGKRRCSINFM